MTTLSGFYNAIKRPRLANPSVLKALLSHVAEDRVKSLSSQLAAYMATFLPVAIRAKEGLEDYRTNPYVLMTTASTMTLENAHDLANFLVNLKLYMGLETSFGKSLESTILGNYPIAATSDLERWHDPPEKLAEFAALSGLGREDKAAARNASVWREIDKTCVIGPRRFLLSIKSGPSTINDTQVEAMKSAIRDHHQRWLEMSAESFGVDGIDVVIGLTYGTERTTNNKENQILVKLCDSGFGELDRERYPGMLTNANGSVRVYRVVGVDFWAFVGSPDDLSQTPYTFLEVLLALAKALHQNRGHQDIESALNERLDMLADAIKALRFPKESAPAWVRDEFTVTELTWLAAAMSTFYDPPSPIL